jgi:pimeloyl-ACP methyl ester carboxylesterase
MGKAFFISLFLVSNIILAQELKIEPYNLISKNNDTIAGEMNSFRVPLDRTKNQSDSLTIHFVRLKSTNPNPESPIVYLTGGPGASGITTAKGSRFPIFNKLREVADVIILDQRGTGLSNTLPGCPYKVEGDLYSPVTREVYASKTKENFEKCLEFWKDNDVNIWAYNTTENARDLEDLRKVLKTDKISFWGLSYGSHLAFEYIRLYEKNIDKLVLASLEGPDETIKYPKDTEAFLFQIAELARTNYGSEIKYDDLKQKMEIVHQRIKENPGMVEIKSYRGTDTLRFSNFELQTAISLFYLKNPIDSKRLPALYMKMYNGDFSEIAGQISIVKNFAPNSLQPLQFAMDMSSGISHKKNKEVRDEIDKSIIGGTINFLFFEWMNSIDYEPLPAKFRKMKNNNVEALLFSGTMDGRTYLSSGIKIAKKFKNGRHIIVENGGHDLYEQSPEIADEVVNFFLGIKSNKKKIFVKPVIFE